VSPRWRTAVAAGKPPPEEGELTDPEVPVTPVPLVRPLRPSSDLRAFLALRQFITASRGRLVHTHMAKAGTLGRLAALSLRRATIEQGRPRLVHTFHGHVLTGYFGATTQRSFLELERALAKRTDVLVAVSPEVRDELLDLRVGRPSQYRVVPLGLDLSRFARVGTPALPAGKLRAALGLHRDVPLAGAVGRLVPIKDHATLLAALAQVPGLHLAVLGDGELRGELEGQSRSLGLAGRAHFVGWWADMPSALADLDVVVLSSRNEGTPVALIEALAAGRPVVSTDVGGVRHVVQDRETGLLCRSGDPAALAGLLQRAVWSDREMVAGLAEEGRRRALSRFGKERMVADYVSIYEELLS
jgi:glycosyltransferase involved in cell wall biosynthesis